MFDRLKAIGRGFRRELKVYRLVLLHHRTPGVAKLLLGLAVAYALSPVDLIPDVIPVAGYLDDLIIVPLLVITALWLIPRDVVDECRRAVGPL
jgi:uncharacterized membrane protein YkvA (DUF1232 family)